MSTSMSTSSAGHNYYWSPSYRGPPLPVLVTAKDLPRVLLVVVVGTLLSMLLALKLDAYFAQDDQDANFYLPYV